MLIRDALAETHNRGMLDTRLNIKVITISARIPQKCAIAYSFFN